MQRIFSYHIFLLSHRLTSMVVDLIARSSNDKIAAGLKHDLDEDKSMPGSLPPKIVNPYKKAKVMENCASFAPAQMVTPVAKIVMPVARAGVNKDPSPTIPPALITLERSSNMKNPFNGKNCLQLNAVDVIYDLV